MLGYNVFLKVKGGGGSLVKISRKIIMWVNFVLLFLLDGKIIEQTNLNSFIVRNYLKAVKKAQSSVTYLKLLKNFQTIH